MIIEQFLEGADGEASSKRLAGLSSAAIFLILSFSGGVVFLVRNDFRSFLEILDTLSIFAGATLGLGVFDNFFKKRYDKTNPTLSNS